MAKGDLRGCARPAMELVATAPGSSQRGSYDQVVAGLLSLELPACYEVGGNVRDEEGGIPPEQRKDIDVMAAGLTLDELNRVCRNAVTAARDAGREGRAEALDSEGQTIGTRLTLPWTPADGVEIALARTEVAGGSGGHKDFVITPLDPPAELLAIPVKDRAAAAREFCDQALEVDAFRRDFSVNAIYRNLRTGELVDPTGGRQDVRDRVLRAVHRDVFRDDRMRMLRAIARISRDGSWPDDDTMRLLADWAPRLMDPAPPPPDKPNAPPKPISGKRIGDEMRKILGGHNVKRALTLASDLGLLERAIPQLGGYVAPDGRQIGSWRASQRNPYHDLNLDQHSIAAAAYAVEIDAPYTVRLGALLHDIGKSEAGFSLPGEDRLRYAGIDDLANVNEAHGLPTAGSRGRPAHQDVSARLIPEILDHWQTDRKIVRHITYLGEHHMYESDNGFSKRSPEAQARRARQFCAKHGDLADDLTLLRICDRAAKSENATKQPEWGAGDEFVFRKAVLHALANEPVRVRDLKINGDDLARMGVAAGPKRGEVLRHLLRLVVDNPDANDRPTLLMWAAKSAGVPAPPDAKVRMSGPKGGDPARAAAARAAAMRS